MSDFGRLQEENRVLAAEVERLNAEVADLKKFKPVVKDTADYFASTTTWPEGSGPPDA